MSTIIIGAYQFCLSEPYEPGPTTLSLAESQALNSLRSDNIRNNVTKWVQAAERQAAERDNPGALLSTETLIQLQHRITEYDRCYTFLERRGNIRSRLSPLEAEIQAVSREARGEAGSSDALIQAEARRRLLLREQEAKKGWEDLL